MEQLIKVGQWMAHNDGTFKARKCVNVLTMDDFINGGTYLTYKFQQRSGATIYYTQAQLTDMLEKHWHIQ